MITTFSYCKCPNLTLNAASRLATVDSWWRELATRTSLMYTLASTVSSDWKDCRFISSPCLEHKVSSWRRGCSVTVSGVAIGLSKGSTTCGCEFLLWWQTSSHDLWLILSWHVTNWSAHQEPVQRFTWFWKVRASEAYPTEGSGYLPDDFNVKICVEQYSTC
jgi:hypothetical protein